LIDEVDAIGLVLGFGSRGNCWEDGGGVGAEAVGEAIGFVENPFAGGDVGGFDVSDGVRRFAQFVHAIARVAGILCLAEDATDASDESCGRVMVVLVTVGGGDGKLSDAVAYLLPSGCAGRQPLWR
jgi:hypothetical protein